MPEVSVIIPNFNHAKFLHQRIMSVLSQSFHDYELIILDDCSLDDSREVIEQYHNHPNVTSVLFNDSNSGSTFIQWKKGLAKARGQYIWIAESDDFSDTNFLEVAVRNLQVSNADLFYCKTVQVDQDGAFLRNLDWWLNDLDANRWNSGYVSDADVEIQQYLSKKNFICNASSVVFKNKPEVLTYLDKIQSMKFCGDWLFWLMYLKGSNLICFSVDTKNYWRDHGATTRSFDSSVKNEEMLKIYRWICDNVEGLNSYQLLKYFYRIHISKKSRKFLVSHLDFIVKGLSYSVFVPMIVVAYFISPKKYTH